MKKEESILIIEKLEQELVSNPAPSLQRQDELMNEIDSLIDRLAAILDKKEKRDLNLST